MPIIKPFRGIHPSPGFVEKVALQVENLDLGQAKLIRQENPFSYINMLVPKVNPLFGRASRQELAFKVINENLEDFEEKGILVQDDEPSIYLYRVNHGGWSQRGVWTITAVDDFITGRIRKHELTREDRERGLVEYLRQTGIDANPVLITYPPLPLVDRLIEKITAGPGLLEFSDGQKTYTLWQANGAEADTIGTAFAALPGAYIADGHHRAAAACSYALARRRSQTSFGGQEEYNFCSSVYMSTAEIRLVAFHRLVKMSAEWDSVVFLDRLQANFNLEKTAGNTPVVPQENGSFGLYLNSAWYRLKVPAGERSTPVSSLDVSRLQDAVLGPLLGITDPRTDPRLHFSGGSTPVENLIRLVDKGEFTLAFTLHPTSIDQLLEVADAGEVMPPKSTWFEPKFQAGLLIHKLW